MRHVYVLTCLVICSYFCNSYSMNRYEFDVDAIEHRINHANSIHDLLTIIIEQLGIARFVAERVTFDRDSYMNYKHKSGTFDYGHMLELLCKEELFFQRHDIPASEDVPENLRLRHDAPDYLSLLHELNTLSDKDYWQACKKFEFFSRKNLEEEDLVPYVHIDRRERWLYHLTECRKKMQKAFGLDPYLGQKTLIEGIDLLAQFSSDLGGLPRTESDRLDFKACLHSNNHILYDMLALLCYAKKTEKTSEELPELAAPAFLDDYFYMHYYGHENDRYPRKAIVEQYGIYDAIKLVPMPRQTACILDDEDEKNERTDDKS